ncbi:MAG TPA: 50S ribosomal protein L28 [Patescibacteria group bacterium]|nr:50S ribosomal protein L28 [Patescibacteria group bacterium]
MYHSCDRAKSMISYCTYMGKKCMNCGKGVMYGHNVSHAKNRTRKIFKPNLHVSRVMIGGHMKRIKLCTKCLRMMKHVEKANTSVISQ